MALLIASLFHLPVDRIERDQPIVSGESVPRPDNAALDSTKLATELGIQIEQADFETTLRRCLEPFV